MSGRFITFEGIDGAGKSTHLDAVAQRLRGRGATVVGTREPGGTPLAERLRELFLHEPMDTMTELLLVFAARRDHVERLIRPALVRGDTVVCDRFSDASFAYQGGGHGAPIALLSELEHWVHGGLQPDLTVWFDLPAETAARRRAQARAADRFEQEDLDFFERVRSAYAARALAAPGRFARIDAAADREGVARQIDAVLRARGVVGSDGALPLPWLGGPLARALATQRGHAVLLHGPQGVGQFELAVMLAQAWLCEAPDAAPTRPCGVCASCRLVQAHSHPDLRVFVPEALREETGWGAEADDAGAEARAGKAKPSREIKVEAVRAAVAFSQSTSARGRAKVVVLHPAERINAVSANTLLKTLEEPPGAARFVLSASAPDALLPTLRSRCQAFSIGLPPQREAAAWLVAQGVDDPQVLLAATGGQPLEALAWSRDGIKAAAWTTLPGQVRQGDASGFSGWPPARTLDALQKLCHDAACVGSGAPPRYFPAASLARGASAAALVVWMTALNRAARHAEHPWNASLLADSLVRQGQHALAA